MSYDLGDVVPLRVTITDADGNPANASAVTLTITLPDGTVTTVGPVAPTETGVYDHDYPTVQAGLHVVHWAATGANGSAYDDVFDVQPAAVTFVSLSDAREHLKKTGLADDDAKLRRFVSAACRMITDRMGHVAPVTLSMEGSGCTVILERPVIAVTSVVKLSGGDVVPAADPAAGTTGWALDRAAGVLTLTRSRGQVRVTYRAGRSPIPANFRLAALELTGHLWRTSQLNGGGGRPSLSADEQVVPGVSYALPYSVRQLLGLDRRPQEGLLVG
ncbi:hypothetical protein C1I98_06120 [Spongiactinospora gelatinilytica]|uniref:Uncharacterized protein n=1 Tax=Spongiactinospora gelatinilytica TaxID=2666298 RepID=A0A2W2HRC4_9ACTN|nr:hypothetical protein [Spongiactinospora gelatinilytica]PZG53130.1 hypothetical protein C1I98_06120 [Spongiactinospora gelatinilytica]